MAAENNRLKWGVELLVRGLRVSELLGYELFGYELRVIGLGALGFVHQII